MMSRLVVFVLVLGLGVVALDTGARAVSRSSTWSVEVLRKGGHSEHYFRRHGNDWRRYYRRPAPSIPIRPLSCGEFRFWDGERCVDVRFR